ncbi:MAG TPA: RNA polymerase sigma factor [Terriglobia bacterium]
MTESDEVLMSAVRGGELDKLGLLFDRHSGALFDFFVRMTSNRAVAEDLVQEVFFRVLKYRKTYRDHGSFRTWMFHIARNARADYFKKHRAEMPCSEEAFEIEDRAPFPVQELEQRQQEELLRRAMLQLAEEKREVLVLARYQEMKYDQIARLLGCEVGAVKVRVHRALKELRELYLKLSSEKQHAL